MQWSTADKGWSSGLGLRGGLVTTMKTACYEMLGTKSRTCSYTVASVNKRMNSWFFENVGEFTVIWSVGFVWFPRRS